MKKLFLAASSALAMAGAQQTAEVADSHSTIRSDSRLVLVDTIVTDRKGAYVRDLSQTDFKVWEDGKEQTVSTFSFQADAAGGPQKHDPQKHDMVLFFDDSTISPTNQRYARLTAAKFIEANAGPDHPIAVMDFNGTLRVAQNFTDDVDRLRQAVNATHLSASTPDPAASAGTGRGGRRSNGDAAFAAYPTRALMTALEDMATGLAPVSGRKTVVLFSEGFRARSQELRDVIEACNRANVAVYPVDIRSLSSSGQSSGPGGGGFTAEMDASSRGGAPTARGGRRGGGGGGGGGADGIAEADEQNPSDALLGLARGTGGFMISRTNDLDTGAGKIAKEQSEYYVLGYVPAKELEPGACHTIKVKVDRSGTNLRSRSSYCDPKTLDVLAGTPTQRELEARLTANAAPTVTAAMQAPFFYTSANIARVDVALDIPGGAVKFAKSGGKFLSKLNVIGIAYLPDGGVAARFSDSVKFAFDDKKQVEAFAANTYHYEKQFPIAAGRFDLKIVFSSSADNFGRVETPLNIDPWDPSKFSSSALVLSKSARRATNAGLGATGSDLFGDKVQLVASGVQFIPSGTNRFRKSDKAFIYEQIYEPALTDKNRKEYPELSAQMILADARTGKPALDTGRMRLKPPEEQGNPAVPLGMILPIADLAPGSYTVQINAFDSAGSQSARKIAFEVEP